VRLDRSRSAGALIALGSLGIVVLIPISASQIATLSSPPLPPFVLSALAALQPLALLSVGALAGVWAAPKVGLCSLVAERVSGRPPAASDLAGIPALVAISVALGLAINFADVLTQPLWLPEGIAWPAYEDAWSPVTLAFGLLYGGITEEVTFRWGLQSLVLWLICIGARKRAVQSWAIGLAILLSALVFAAGHLPAVGAVMPLTAGPVLRTLIFNSLMGLWLGWIFARWHLEAAMLSHAAIHIGFALYVLGMLALR
jgi:hypothetical protein